MGSAGKFISVAVLLLFKGVSAGDKCPVIETVADFDLERYVEKSWFIQRQQKISYSKEDSFFCISATYNNEGVKNWGRDATSVYNYANEGGINTDSDSIKPFCATRKDPAKEPAKLSVVPCKLPNFLAGPYWVAAVGSDYEWAIVVGGQPDVKGECGSENLCTTGDLYIGGLWFLTRVQVASNDTLNDMEDTARSLGICTANMLDVVQEGCTYDGHFLKL